MDRKLDRLLAHRFNALDYLRTDELGLSRIVGDLLDPDGAHGQGARFLAQFAKLIGQSRWPVERTVGRVDLEVEVVREREIDNGRRLDISVELRQPGRDSACIAIENKPYAADADAQIADYLKFLRRCYPRRFLLIHLSQDGGRPSENSLPKDACTDGLATMSYHPQTAADECEDDLRLPFSLSDWLRECWRICDAERLRWFLREVEAFCHKQFGGTVTTQTEREEVKSFILASEDNVRTAMTVVEAWPETVNEVAGRYLAVLRNRVEDGLRSIDGLQIESQSHSEKQWGGVLVSREAWSKGNDSAGVWLVSEKGFRGWSVGVFLDFGDGDARDRLGESLRRCPDLRGSDQFGGWHWYRYLDKHGDWRPLLAGLHREMQEPGELTDYFSRELIETAKTAVPIIDGFLKT